MIACDKNTESYYVSIKNLEIDLYNLLQMVSTKSFLHKNVF